jgi:hypothetical protein
MDKNDKLDFSHAAHFAGSGVLAVGFYKFFQSWNIKHPKVWAGVFASSLGLLKEWEDGYREGWGIYDSIFNQLGIVTFLLLSEYTHFTVTYEQVLLKPNNFGVGLRFFRTSEFKPLNTSFGFYTYISKNQEVRMGLDTHLLRLSRLELHFGVTFIGLRDANMLDIRPDVGLGFKLF